jgi:hypothetical protein
MVCGGGGLLAVSGHSLGMPCSVWWVDIVWNTLVMGVSCECRYAFPRCIWEWAWNASPSAWVLFILDCGCH